MDQDYLCQVIIKEFLLDNDGDDVVADDDIAGFDICIYIFETVAQQSLLMDV